MSFGENLRHIRTKKGLSQKDVALLLNTTQQHISQLEKNLREPNLEDIRRLRTIFDLPTDLLIQDVSYNYGSKSIESEIFDLLTPLSDDGKRIIRDLLLFLAHNS